ncbi:hypothetical protein SAMN05421869_10874 [Nonomuraea jiangxiensis]|uniref:Uncharacterized protein n=1 Tax=Nonomuraea jiangxiensis TaxID=633440 RepID=A0A1G8Q0B1_9ACTN|nr:hypothetical protein SAMN05421869_10874 [Nonomuraea jiangxiensis]
MNQLCRCLCLGDVCSLKLLAPFAVVMVPLILVS